MPQLTDIALRTYFKWRQKNIEKVLSDPAPFQSRLLQKILNENSNTQYGKKYTFTHVNNYTDYKKAVPLVAYNDIENHIHAMIDGKHNVLNKDVITWFAKSSGTSNNRSKYIPVSKNYLTNGHLKCAWDAASYIYNEDPQAKLFADKTFIMGGSIEELGNNKFAGDISAIILHHFPKIGRRFYTPDFETALMKNWDEKIKRMAKLTADENVTLFAGVPSWTLVLFEEILKQTGKENISEVWPNLKSYLHGGVGFEPYEKLIRQMLPSPKVNFREVYNASEGYFGIQNQKQIEGMTLLFDHEIFYEFIPFESIDETNPTCLTIDEVEKGKRYVLVITNSSGLYRYKMDDVIEFTSTKPYKIKVRSRTQQYLNAFGEELMVCNTDTAIATTCLKHQAVIKNYTVAPQFMGKQNTGRHEWLIEFAQPPQNLNAFKKDLDLELRTLNSDYDAKRSYDLVMSELNIQRVEQGTFENWLRSKGKYGGQNKIPRLSNTRKLIEEILSIEVTIAEKKIKQSTYQ